MDKRLERILPQVQKPARYTGGEYNQIIKDKDSVDIRLAFCFPDTYEIGMSNLGMSILYHTMNSLDFVWCERAFAPWGDMYEKMKQQDIALYALESGDSLACFDALAFSVGYEMAYTTVLDMLDMSGIPVRAKDRPDLLPLVFAGGSAAVNPEPMADFMDLFVVGEGEEMNNELLTLLRKAKLEGWTKTEFLREASQIQGVYVPSLYDVSYNADGTIAAYTAKEGTPQRVTKRIIADLDSVPFPTNPIVPSTEVVHDRVNLELFRGCVRGCRFCQAGHIYRPIRAKKPETLVKQGIESLKNTGHEDVTLLSLSTSDYRPLNRLCDGMLEYCESRSIGLSLPSLRADNFSIELMQKLQKVRKSGLTFAVEGGSQRLRDAINKNVTEEDLLNTCSIAFAGGWNSVKLYYMLGLPTETDEDILGIAEMANQVLHCWRTNAKNKNRGVKITISTSCFIPKPHSPFQWEAQISIEEYLRRVNLLRSAITARNVTYNWHDAETSLVEAVLSRGDRRLSQLIERVWRKGSRLDAWSDYFSFTRWMEAFEECGIDPAFYANRDYPTDSVLPWDVIDVGVRKEHLLHERQQCYASALSPDCRKQCSGCGAAALLKGGRCDG
ncbi:MAG: TIGR03960 family B12-binding radical SAM protein [Oscillospiraceae bacterium]|nr:TIGR03960 family B12-binding radical SAM protein [Oscillospiraceae bacterium]